MVISFRIQISEKKPIYKYQNFNFKIVTTLNDKKKPGLQNKTLSILNSGAEGGSFELNRMCFCLKISITKKLK